MNRSDYKALAECLRKSRPLVGGSVHTRTIKQQQWLEDIREIALCLQRQNPRFDYDQFLTACGVNGLGGKT